MEILADLRFNISLCVKRHRMLTCNFLKYPFGIGERNCQKESLQFSALYFKDFDKLESDLGNEEFKCMQNELLSLEGKGLWKM